MEEEIIIDTVNLIELVEYIDVTLIPYFQVSIFLMGTLCALLICLLFAKGWTSNAR